MMEVLRANKEIGIMSIEGSNWEIEDINEEETYSIVCGKQINNLEGENDYE